jgi:hypothetical protein
MLLLEPLQPAKLVKSAQLSVCGHNHQTVPVMSTGTPRHLANPPPLRRRWQIWTGVGVAVLLVVTAMAWVGRSDGPERPRTADRSAATSESSADATATTAAATATTAAQGADDGPKNLLANDSFENGSEGWRPLGGARLTRSTDAHLGEWSLRVLAGSSAEAPVGITVPDVTLTKAQGRYHTNAWVKPSSPGATVTIGLREYHNGQPVPGSNTLGWTVEQAGWRKFGAIHVASQPGSRLALEIMARDLPPGGYLDIDEVVLHQLKSQS